MTQVELQDPELDATDPHTRRLLLAEHWKREAMLHKSRADTQREELLRAWFVLKEFGHHPGRTDDTLSECLRRALAANCKDAADTERHACSIAVWMTLQDALEPDADDKGLEGWMREAEQRVKNRLAHHLGPNVRANLTKGAADEA